MACNEKNPLQRDGSSQSQRFLKALDPASAPVEQLGLDEWLQFAAAYAAKLNYFNTNDSDHPQGDWTPFFIEDKQDIDALVQNVQAIIANAEAGFPDDTIQSNIEPHLALFIAFILLLQHSQDAINLFTGRHLDFYYQRVLQLKNNPAVPDKVHVIYELAKNLPAFLLPQGTQLDAGKDQSTKPKPLVYQTTADLAINNATLAAMKSLYHDTTDKEVLYADITNSADGLGTPIKDDIPKWNAFGSTSWPAATMGFSVASKILLLSEGARTITITITFGSAPSGLDASKMAGAFKVFFTSDKDWISGSFPTTGAFTLNGAVLTIVVNLTAKDKAVVPYNQAIHKENYNTDLPVMRLLLSATGDGYAIYTALSAAKPSKIVIQVDVKGMKNLQIENDNGPVDPSKPFQAFGAQPKAGSNLFIGSAEIFQKNWTKITPTILWKNLPDDMKTQYYCYRKNYLLSGFCATGYSLTSSTDDNADGGLIISSQDKISADVTYLKDGAWYPTDTTKEQVQLFSPFHLEPDETVQDTTAGGGGVHYMNKTKYFGGKYNSGKAYGEKAVVEQYLEGNDYYYWGWGGLTGIVSGIITETGNFSAGAKDNFIRITLTTDLLHSLYPQIYAVAMVKGGGALIPKEPFTPQIAALTLDYSATATNDINALSTATTTDLLSDYIDRGIQLFHETPFGQKEQHLFLKSQFGSLVSQTITLMPQAPALAGFYLGISNIANGSIVSLLFQVAEGSEDPTQKTFSDTVKPQWYFLAGNEWLALDKQNIVSDDTNNFLRPGILQIKIPDTALTTNTFMNNGLTWLGVELPTGVSVNSVCKFINVHIQAGQASFLNQDNELSHLLNGIAPGTISKLVNRLPQVKTITQPYASFGGLPPEDDQDFRTRVSERLRHKNRAVNIWDYEHMVMSKFPQVYRVKCLNHTNDDVEVAPGSVRVVVIPDIHNKNTFDPFKPMVSTNTLSEIGQYLSNLIDLHVDLKVINPDYEEIVLDFSVKFYKGLDDNVYHDKLNTDLIGYLSPWAYNQDAEIDFGGTLYKSVVIRFIEELPYVDYIANFKMYFTATGVADPDVLQAGNSKAILVSAKQHNIDTTSTPVCS